MRLNRTSPASLRKPAFSLVELLVVIGIISLLIGIALPAFSRAKEATKIATTNATITTLSTGIEQLRTDERLGGDYPPSKRANIYNPHVPGNSPPQLTNGVNGASLLVYALAGADLLGSAGIRDANGIDDTGLNPAGRAAWADDLSMRATSPEYGLYRLGAYNKPEVARTSYVDINKTKLTRRINDGSTPMFEIPSSKARMNSLAFLDSFDQPILYYKATAGLNLPVADIAVSHARPQAGIYNMDDNAGITGSPASKLSPLDLGAGTGHFPKGVALGSNTPFNDLLDPAKRVAWKGTFAHTVFNPTVTATVQPQNAETYILLSAGPDGLFGTEDDIANYPMAK